MSFKIVLCLVDICVFIWRHVKVLSFKFMQSFIFCSTCVMLFVVQSVLASLHHAAEQWHAGVPGRSGVPRRLSAAASLVVALHSAGEGEHDA